MNDRFKFRWYSYIYNEMCEVNCIEPINGCVNFNQGKHNNISTAIKPENGVFMQCTGLKDKNGKLIYEGDIVKITKENWQKDLYSLIYLVCWDRTQWQLGLEKSQRPKAQKNRRSDRKIPFKNIVSFEDYTPIKFFAECEVIGNIYENKELLEEECQK